MTMLIFYYTKYVITLKTLNKVCYYMNCELDREEGISDAHNYLPVLSC